MHVSSGGEPADRPGASDADLVRARRTVGAVAVGAAVVMWWPAFTLGAWGEVFFEQVLTLWAAATASLLLLVFGLGAERIRRPLVASLLLPSLWVALEFLPLAQGTVLETLVTWFGVALTVVGLPAMAWVILRVARPDVVQAMPVRVWLAAGGAVAAVTALSVLLGWLQPYYLTCEDFAVSGNSQPPNCTPATTP